mgnify:CR=1 FL=1
MKSEKATQILLLAAGMLFFLAGIFPRGNLQLYLVRQ